MEVQGITIKCIDGKRHAFRQLKLKGANNWHQFGWTFHRPKVVKGKFIDGTEYEQTVMSTQRMARFFCPACLMVCDRVVLEAGEEPQD